MFTDDTSPVRVPNLISEMHHLELACTDWFNHEGGILIYKWFCICLSGDWSRGKPNYPFWQDRRSAFSGIFICNVLIYHSRHVMKENVWFGFFQAQSFKKQGTQMRRKMWYQNMKIKLVVLGIILLLVLVIWVSVCQGFDCTN